ncbi:ABC transporter permease [Ideonella livida]|uniref:ABC transporter permease n=1 Tax=Ideonella livida TaxID=2707176 RepID=A0A7C9PJ54_9BURK|nr:ABC transporter permease [Ideonella livida]NDY92310.1 ABC transporter permease [Ideonella livida]
MDRPRALRRWHLSWAEWRAHPWRQLAALLSVALGVALAFSVHLINESALSEFSAATRTANGEPDLSLVGQGPAGLDEQWLPRLAGHAAVQLVHPRLDLEVLARPLPQADRPAPAWQALQLRGVDPLTVSAVAPALMPRATTAAGATSDEAGSDAPTAAGARPAGLDLLDPERLWLNPAAAQALGLTGPTVAHATHVELLVQGRTLRLRVAGAVGAAGPPLAVMDVAGAQRLQGDAPPRLSRVDLRLAPGADRQALLADLQRGWDGGPALPATVQAESPDDSQQRVSALSRAYRVNLTVLALVALVVGAFLVFSVVSLAVAQRTPALALLGVLGLDAAGRRRLVLWECAALGAVASLLGLAAGTGMAMAALRLLAGDLGGGYFTGVAPSLRWDGAAAVLFGGLGVLAAVTGGLWPAAQAARLAPAQALKGLGQTTADVPPAWPALALLAAGALLALLPPWQGLPLAAYGAVAAWLVGGIALVPRAVHLLLGHRGPGPARHPLLLLALQRARRHRGTATAAVAGVVASLALCVALTVMVASFRSAVADWLETVLPADLYARAGEPGQAGAHLLLPPDLPQAAAALPGVARVQPGRSLMLRLSPRQPAVWLQARPLGPDPTRRLPLLSAPQPAVPGEVGVFVSEAVVALHGVAPGATLTLPLEHVDGGGVTVRVRGVWRDYARQFGSIAMDLDDYRRLSGDPRLNELALWLHPGAAPAEVEAGLRRAMTALGAPAQPLETAGTAQIKALSMQIFDRSFAVTRYLQAVAIAIGLAGVAASLSAQVLARRREFGLLVHLGLTRRQVLQVVVLETAGWLGAGVLVGTALGLAISAVLVFVVNPQSFHWTMPLQVPVGQLAELSGAVLAAGLLTTALTARRAAGGDAVRAVKEDW